MNQWDLNICIPTLPMSNICHRNAEQTRYILSFERSFMRHVFTEAESEENSSINLIGHNWL
jgi:hypothetical protein